ncbi:MAG TPA: hypothetical protein VNL14_16515 [Candidatus Acidoferrales bacterium]|nr:hypothetical protein [Candidatus Acidoferrales bacterium]
MKTNGKINLKMEFERDTKRTYRFKEVAPEGEEVIGTLYVKKAAFGGKAPAKIEVSVNVVDGKGS